MVKKEGRGMRGMGKKREDGELGDRRKIRYMA